MVSTRGNPVLTNERKSALPTRESRRGTRGALQEPEDEVHGALCLLEGGRRVYHKVYQATGTQLSALGKILYSLC